MLDVGMVMKKGEGIMHKITVSPDESLIICIYSGQITIEEIDTATKEMLSHPEYYQGMDGICDFRQARVIFTRSELEQFSRTAVESRAYRMTWCLLADSPMETAMALIFANELKNVHTVGVFSTVKGASDFLKRELNPYLNENYRSRRVFSAPVSHIA